MWEIDADKIINDCLLNCFQEMYKWAQPSLDFKDFYKKLQNHEIIEDRDSPTYEHHYLSHNNFTKIKDHYLTIYNLKPYWKEHCEVIKDYLFKGGYRDIFIEPEDGRPGYRSSEKTLPVSSFLSKEDTEKLSALLDDCSNFYRLDRAYNEANIAICLGCSPTCNKQSVIDYWKSKGKDITIEDFDIYDKIYGDE